MKRMRIAALIATLVLGASPLLASSIIGPTYPAPGGNTFNSTGALGSGSGATFNYGGFDPTQYSQLWWGVLDVQNVYNSNVDPSGTGNMAFASYNSVTGVAEYDSTAAWTFTSGTGAGESFNTRMLVTFAPSDLSDVTSQSAAGISGNPDPVLDVPGSYSLDVVFQAQLANGSWEAVDDLYNSIGSNCGGCVVTSLDGGFWYSAPNSATPEPGTLLLFGSGMFTLAGVFRRKFSRS
jgi:hypothetical protein